ncbi:hypothetical protein SKAU_G00017760 [Synaphobranchus kaupii]|uniref:Uncharacterized protein n=1 Tax=Synaphobranchus kaupii TaxID=118154 RepID=A0A9Q1JCT9_SYNKA|nr:hypothetical protein SKAU_G00017760 [Synaphobranchus kaupii]
MEPGSLSRPQDGLLSMAGSSRTLIYRPTYFRPKHQRGSSSWAIGFQCFNPISPSPADQYYDQSPSPTGKKSYPPTPPSLLSPLSLRLTSGRGRWKKALGTLRTATPAAFPRRVDAVGLHTDLVSGLAGIHR